jgi:hypothetical protein
MQAVEDDEDIPTIDTTMPSAQQGPMTRYPCTTTQLSGEVIPRCSYKPISELDAA